MRLSDNTRGWFQALPFGVLLFVLWPIIGLNKALPAATIAVVFSVLLEQHWELRRDRTFQVVFVALVVIHVAAIWLIPLPRASVGLIALPFAFLDYFAVATIIRSVRRGSGTSHEG